MSELVLKESSNSDSSSSDDELNLNRKKASNYNFAKMIKGKEKVDKRLIDQFFINQAHRMGVPLDFNDENINQNKDEKKPKEKLEE